MLDLTPLPSPCLLLDRERLERNLDRWVLRAKQLGVAWRPHMKTAKSIDVGELLRQRGVVSGAVSTLAEAEALLNAGWTDLIYAVPVTPDKLPRVRKLMQGRPAGALKVMVESVASAKAVAAEPGIATLIELDCGAGRGGIDPESPQLLEVARSLADSTQLVGVLTHAGQSYLANGREEQAAIAERERQTVVTAAERLRAAGYSLPIVSVGSTPTAATVHDLSGVTEFRPGVGVFFDLYQHHLGVCSLDEIALSVLCRVVATDVEQQRFWVDAGSLALSADRSANRFDASIGFGRVADLSARPIAGLTLDAAHQEHGFIRVESPAHVKDFPIGTGFRILPNHACITAAMHNEYRVLEGDRVVDRWKRICGW
jgi:D-serine deaminase-like pyridoxal phosphate-dependent protein